MTRKKILIIDDNANYRVILHRFLSPRYDLVEASGGADGFRKAQEELPDVIICDLIMPGEDGFWFCQKAKECEKTCCIPIILLTSFEQPEAKIRLIELGVDDYVVKPFDPGYMLARIENLIKNRGLFKLYYGGEPAEDYKQIHPFTDRAIGYIEQHLSEPDFSVQKLAGLLCVSHASLYRRVKENLQLSPLSLIRNIRLIRASYLLKNKDLSVVEIAESVGYNDLSSFRRHFTEYFGKVPSVYAKE